MVEIKQSLLWGCYFLAIAYNIFICKEFLSQFHFLLYFLYFRLKRYIFCKYLYINIDIEEKRD